MGRLLDAYSCVGMHQDELPVFLPPHLLRSQDGLYTLFLWSMMAIVFAWTVGFWFAQLFTCGTHFFAIWGSVRDLVQYCGKTLKK
jgi:hypothetical protein